MLYSDLVLPKMHILRPPPPSKKWIFVQKMDFEINTWA